MKQLLSTLPLPLLLAACGGFGFDDTVEIDICPASELTELVGGPEDVADTIDYDGPVRVIHPDSVITEDYRPERLNIDVNDAGLIERFWCG